MVVICADIDDLRQHTDYSGWRPSDSVIQWFWQVVADLDDEEKALLLQFVTGTWI